MQVTLDEEGETRVRERFVVSAPVMGRVERIELEPGDAVVRGKTVVARLTPAAAPLINPRSQAELSAAAEAALQMSPRASRPLVQRCASSAVSARTSLEIGWSAASPPTGSTFGCNGMVEPAPLSCSSVRTASGRCFPTVPRRQH